MPDIWFMPRGASTASRSTGTQASISQALGALSNAGGGTLLLSAGAYTTTAVFQVPSNTTVTLAAGATITAQTGFPASSGVFRIGDGSSVVSDVTIKGPGTIDGNAIAWNGILTTGPNVNIRVLDLEVTGTAFTGIWIEGVSVANPGIGVLVRGCYVHDAGEGITVVYSTDVQMIGNRVEDMSSQDCLEVSRVTRFVVANNLAKNPGPGNNTLDIFDDSHDGTVVGNVFVATTGTPATACGMDTGGIGPCTRVVIANNVIAGKFLTGIGNSPSNDEVLIVGNLIRDFDRSGANGMSIQGNNVQIIGNRIMRVTQFCIQILGAISNIRIIDNDLIDCAHGADSLAHIQNNNASATNIVIKGNRMSKTTVPASYVFNIDNTAGTQMLIEGNELRGEYGGGRPINNQNDSGLTVRRNTGFITENNGTATIANGTTSIAVTHGLSRTPDLQDISVTPTNNLGLADEFWISTPTSTQFTINVNVDPGAGTATFVWTAAVI